MDVCVSMIHWFQLSQHNIPHTTAGMLNGTESNDISCTDKCQLVTGTENCFSWYAGICSMSAVMVSMVVMIRTFTKGAHIEHL